jgi:hypothetical protein
MTRSRRTPAPLPLHRRCVRWLRATAVWLAALARDAVRTTWRRRSRWWHTWKGGHGARVEVVITERRRARQLEREVRHALRRLHRVLGPALADSAGQLSVVVQQVLGTERPVAGCCQRTESAGAARLTLVRLALEVDGRRLSTDEVLAALAEQLIGLATQPGLAPGTVVTVDLRPSASAAPAPMAKGEADSAPPPAPTDSGAGLPSGSIALPPDPLAPLSFHQSVAGGRGNGRVA